MQPIKFYDAGALNPYALHALYEGLATALAPEESPWLVWARADQGHVSIGASQSAEAELDLAACRLRRIPVVQRALGGGAVWVDPRQLCVFLIFPQAVAPRTQAALFSLCLELLAETFASLGVNVERVGTQDLWAGGRKLLGSGAATVGRSMVFGASLLEQFDSARFADCLQTPSAGFGDWLREALASGMTDLSALQPRFRAEDWVAALASQCEARWGVEPAMPEPAQLQAMAEAEQDLRQPLETGGLRRVRGGLKINQETYLVEDTESPWIRLLLKAGRLDRGACADPELAAVLRACQQHPVTSQHLSACANASGLAGERAAQLVQRVMRLCDIPGRTP